MDSPLGFAVIGTGRIGLRRIRALVERPLATVVAVFDSESDVAVEAAAAASCSPVSDVASAIRSADADCVVVAVPNKFHLDAVVEALAEGKHVLCEKPLTRTPDEAIAMVRAAARHGRFLKVGSNLRHFPNVRKALELAESGAIGEPMFLRGWIGRYSIEACADGVVDACVRSVGSKVRQSRRVGTPSAGRS